ncbi:MAG: phosphate-starvation-inducible PsiE family protein [Gammaproteobacteria bacterium]|nr:phosphate-starvation-inducible PsiE family protein [Gammaproteobacteria bacterium]
MNYQTSEFSSRFLALFNRVVEVVFGVILLFLVLGIIVGTAKLFLNLKDIVSVGTVTGSYLKTISDVLSLFILIELSRSLVEYFDCKRLRMTFIVDAGIVFVLREIMIKLFQDKLPVDHVYALSVLLLVLGLLRVGSIVVSERERAVFGVASGPVKQSDGAV